MRQLYPFHASGCAMQRGQGNLLGMNPPHRIPPMSTSRACRSAVLLSMAIAWTVVVGVVPAVRAQVPVPESVEADGVAAVPSELQANVARYLAFRTAGFRGWRPGSRSVLIATRFADTPQLHLVAKPGGDRKQLTFDREPIS